MKKQSVLGADLATFARYLRDFPASDRLAAARAVIAEAHDNLQPGGNGYRCSVMQICWPIVDRAKNIKMELTDRDNINAYEAALIALDEYVRKWEAMEATT